MTVLLEQDNISSRLRPRQPRLTPYGSSAVNKNNKRSSSVAPVSSSCGTRPTDRKRRASTVRRDVDMDMTPVKIARLDLHAMKENNTREERERSSSAFLISHFDMEEEKPPAMYFSNEDDEEKPPPMYFSNEVDDHMPILFPIVFGGKQEQVTEMQTPSPSPQKKRSRSRCRKSAPRVLVTRSDEKEPSEEPPALTQYGMPKRRRAASHAPSTPRRSDKSDNKGSFKKLPAFDFRSSGRLSTCNTAKQSRNCPLSRRSAPPVSLIAIIRRPSTVVPTKSSYYGSFDFDCGLDEVPSMRMNSYTPSIAMAEMKTMKEEKNEVEVTANIDKPRPEWFIGYRKEKLETDTEKRVRLTKSGELKFIQGDREAQERLSITRIKEKACPAGKKCGIKVWKPMEHYIHFWVCNKGFEGELESTCTQCGKRFYTSDAIAKHLAYTCTRGDYKTRPITRKDAPELFESPSFPNHPNYMTLSSNLY